MINAVKLTEEQAAICELLEKGLASKQIQVLGGLAGTGKTTLLIELYSRLQSSRNVQVCCPTGKAADVLSRKGVRATTIHKLLYRFLYARTKSHTCKNAKGEEIEMMTADELYFAWANKLPELLLIDEASMLSAEMFREIVEAGIQCVLFGDHGQLPPVAGKSSVMASPDYRLETVHRNAGPVAHFCHWLREGNMPQLWEGGGVHFVDRLSVADALVVDQVICGTNSLRRRLNLAMRQQLGFIDVVEPGEKVCSLHNNGQYFCNGSIFTVLEVCANHITIESLRGRNKTFAVRLDLFGLDKQPHLTRDIIYRHGWPFDYAYAITCHKSQGSEWQSVAVVDESKYWPDQMRQWRYTAASRAKSSLTWASGAKCG